MNAFRFQTGEVTLEQDIAPDMTGYMWLATWTGPNALPGVSTQGRTIDEALQRIQEAISLAKESEYPRHMHNLAAAAELVMESLPLDEPKRTKEAIRRAIRISNLLEAELRHA